MKIGASVIFNPDIAEVINAKWVTVNVDMDYVEADENDVTEYVATELEEMYGRSFSTDEFEITNMADILEDIKFDEFLDKTN